MPAVIRIPSFGGIRGKEHHGESPETYYAHTAGLKVVVPSTPLDAYRLLRRSIDDPDPVIFLEPKSRYWSKEDGDLTAEGPGIGRGEGRSGGRGLRPDRLRRDGRPLPRGRDRPGGGRDRDDRPRPPVAGPARRGGDRRRRPVDRTRGRRARGAAHPRDGRRDRGADRRGGVRPPRGAGRAGHRVRTCRTRPRPSNSATSRASSGSRTPSARWWPTDGRARLHPARPGRGSRGGDRERVARRRGRHGLPEPAVRRDRDGQGDGRGARAVRGPGREAPRRGGRDARRRARRSRRSRWRR